MRSALVKCTNMPFNLREQITVNFWMSYHGSRPDLQSEKRAVWSC
jgi:hypothetical protein